MCTAISLNSGNHYFGRTLDYNISFGERIVITPREFNLKFKYLKPLNSHYAIIGMGILSDNSPLYFDATNEKGLSIAALLFSENAKYFSPNHNYTNIASFEVIPYVLAQCKNIDDAKAIISNINITNDDFNGELKATPLHWLISDKNESIVLESTDNGVNIYDNPVGVLTNNPPFNIQLWNLSQYISLSPKSASNRFSEKLSLNPQSKGMGAVGLPGDFSSASRFIRAAFVKLNYTTDNKTLEAVEFFHLLNSVFMPRGTVLEKDGYEITRYTSCCDTECGIYYYTTYDNPNISAVDINDFDLTSSFPICINLKTCPQIYYHK